MYGTFWEYKQKQPCFWGLFLFAPVRQGWLVHFHSFLRSDRMEAVSYISAHAFHFYCSVCQSFIQSIVCSSYQKMTNLNGRNVLMAFHQITSSVKRQHIYLSRVWKQQHFLKSHYRTWKPVDIWYVIPNTDKVREVWEVIGHPLFAVHTFALWN